MVDWSVLTKAYKYVGVEILAIIGVILAIQEVFQIELNLNFVIYILIVAAFVDGLIKLALNVIHRVRIQFALDTKMTQEYSVEQLKAELSKDKTALEEASSLAETAKTAVENKKAEITEKKIAELQAQIESLSNPSE